MISAHRKITLTDARDIVRGVSVSSTPIYSYPLRLPPPPPQEGFGSLELNDGKEE